MCRVSLWGSSRFWCTWHGGQSIHWPSLGRGLDGSHVLRDLCNTRSVQWGWGGGVLTLDCRGYGTAVLRGIPFASWYGNTSHSMGKLITPWRPTLVLILTITKTSNSSYDWSRLRVKTLGRHYPTWMFDVKTVGIMSSASICNGRWGRLLL